MGQLGPPPVNQRLDCPVSTLGCGPGQVGSPRGWSRDLGGRLVLRQKWGPDPCKAWVHPPRPSARLAPKLQPAWSRAEQVLLENVTVFTEPKNFPCCRGDSRPLSPVGGRGSRASPCHPRTRDGESAPAWSLWHSLGTQMTQHGHRRPLLECFLPPALVPQEKGVGSPKASSGGRPPVLAGSTVAATTRGGLESRRHLQVGAAIRAWWFGALSQLSFCPRAKEGQ